MDEEKIPYTYHSADESPIPVPPVEEAWALMKKELDVKMPVRRWYRRLGGWWWMVGLVGVVGLGVVAGAEGWFGKPLASEKKARMGGSGVGGSGVGGSGVGDSGVGDSGVVVSAGARGGAREDAGDSIGIRSSESWNGAAGTVGEGPAEEGTVGAGSAGARSAKARSAKATEKTAAAKARAGRKEKHSTWGNRRNERGKHAAWGNSSNKNEKHATWGNTAKRSGRHATWGNGTNATAGSHARWGTGAATAAGRAAKATTNEEGITRGRQGNIVAGRDHKRIPMRVGASAKLEKTVSAAPKTVQAADSLLSSIRGSKKAAIAGKDKKGKNDPGNGPALSMSAGLSLGHGFPIGQQQTSSYSSNGKSNVLLDYIPAPYFRLYLGDRIYLQGAVHFNSPQYTQSQLIDTSRLDSSRIAGYSGYLQKNELTLKKLFYTNIPISFHYRVFKGLYLGAGIQYSALWGAAGEETIHLTPNNGGADTIYSQKGIGLKNKDTVYSWLSKSEWRVLFEADYRWRRWTFGLRYEQALKPYMPVTLYGTKSSQRNASYGIHVYYDLWEKGRKKN